MKRNLINSCVAIISLMTIASCAKEPTAKPVPQPGDGMTINAVAQAENANPGAATKTAISDGEGKTKIVSWVANDAINVIYGTEDAQRVSATTTTGGEQASFNFNVPTGTGLITAVNPASATANLDADGNVNVVIPAIQTGAFADGNISVCRVAAASSVQMQFKNATSFFKVVSTDAEITKFVLTAKGEEAIAGTLPVSFDASNVPTPQTALATNTASSITVNVSAAGTYYIAVLPGVTYTKGVRLDVYKGENLATYLDFETAETLTLERSNIANFGTVTLEFIGEGLKNLYATAAGGTGKYYTTKASYEKGEAIEVHIPSASENMLKNITMYPTLDDGNTIYPVLPNDYSTAFTMNIRDAKGHCDPHQLSINTKVAKIDKVWEKDATQTMVTWYNRMRIAADKNKVYILDNIMNYQAASDEIRVLNASDGSYAGVMAAPSQYLGDINVDDAGNLIVTRYNCMWGCGLLAYVYNPGSSTWTNFVYWATTSTPENVGERVSVVGNVKEGTAYMYATTVNSKTIYRWQFTNGGIQYGPTYTEEYTGTTDNWNNAIVRRASVAADSPVYIGVTMGTSAQSYADAAAYIDELGTTNRITGSTTYGPRILNFKNFKFKNEEYIAVLFQESYLRYSAAYVRIFNVTDRGRWTMVPGAERYNLDFAVATTAGFGGANYDQSGGLDVVVDGDNAYIYLACPAKGSGDASYDAANTKVVCYKMYFE